MTPPPPCKRRSGVRIGKMKNKRINNIFMRRRFDALRASAPIGATEVVG